MSIDERKLLDLKEQVEEAKIKVSELTGQQTALMKQLKEEFGCTTIEQAQKKLETMEKEITVLDKKIEEGVQELKTKYNLDW